MTTFRSGWPACRWPCSRARSRRRPEGSVPGAAERVRRADRGPGGQRRGGGHRPPGEPGDRPAAGRLPARRSTARRCRSSTSTRSAAARRSAPGAEERLAGQGAAEPGSGQPGGHQLPACSSTTSSRSPAARRGCCATSRTQLSRLGPEDRMAIVAGSGGRVEMLSSWSSSERQLGDGDREGDRRARVRRGADRRAAQLPGVAAPRPAARLDFGARPSFGPRQLDLEELEFAGRVAAQTERAVGGGGERPARLRRAAGAQGDAAAGRRLAVLGARLRDQQPEPAGHRARGAAGRGAARRR